jgi:hypothetical protein
MANNDVGTIVGFIISLPFPILLIINAIKEVDAPFLLAFFFLLLVISFGLCAQGYKRNKTNENKLYKNIALIGVLINVISVLLVLGYFIFI